MFLTETLIKSWQYVSHIEYEKKITKLTINFKGIIIMFDVYPYFCLALILYKLANTRGVQSGARAPGTLIIEGRIFRYEITVFSMMVT